MSIPGTVQITGQLAPTSTSDVFATHDAQYGKDGYRTVATHALRDSYDTTYPARCIKGMLICTANDNLVWQLNTSTFTGTSADWTQFGTGGGGLPDFTDSLKTTSPYSATTAASQLAATNTSSTDQWWIINPKGAGGISTKLADSSTPGGNIPGQYAVDLQCAPITANTQVATGNYSFLGAGVQNTAAGTACGIVAGLVCTVGGDYSFIGGSQHSNTGLGQGNIILGGSGHSISVSNYSAIVAGTGHSISVRNGSVALGGVGNSITGTQSIALGGTGLVVDALNAVVMGSTTSSGGMIGVFAFSGAADPNFIVGARGGKINTLQADTTNATPLAMTVDGTAASGINQFPCPNSNMAVKLRGSVLVKKATTFEAAWWDISGCVINNAGTLTLIGTPTISAFNGSAALSGCTVSILADTTNKAIQVQIKGLASTTLTWTFEGSITQNWF